MKEINGENNIEVTEVDNPDEELDGKLEHQLDEAAKNQPWKSKEDGHLSLDQLRGRMNEIIDNNEEQKYNVIDDNPLHKNCPVENGRWVDQDGLEGERGESKWIPERQYIPQKSNPDNLSWGEILDSYEIDGIEFKDGEPQFDKLIKDEVKIEKFTEDRSDNFDQADQQLAEKWGIDVDEVTAWRKEIMYTWHECRDME